MGFLLPAEALKTANSRTRHAIDEKCFSNYWTVSEEINSAKIGNRWRIDEGSLDQWLALREQRIVDLATEDYEECFEFALELTYAGLSRFGMAGQRSEMQVVDNTINGILVERALKYFLERKFGTQIVPDWEVHPGHITPKDIVGVIEGGVRRDPRLFVGVKGSKLKNGYLIADEHGMPGRSADIYVFGRTSLPSDHLFRYLRNHSFFADVKGKMERSPGAYKKTLAPLEGLYVWICGFAMAEDLDIVTEIPNQDFGEKKYVKSVADLRNSDGDWREFCRKL